jgi:hypothetical protein
MELVAGLRTSHATTLLSTLSLAEKPGRRARSVVEVGVVESLARVERAGTRGLRSTARLTRYLAAVAR